MSHQWACFDAASLSFNLCLSSAKSNSSAQGWMWKCFMKTRSLFCKWNPVASESSSSSSLFITKSIVSKYVCSEKRSVTWVYHIYSHSELNLLWRTLSVLHMVGTSSPRWRQWPGFSRDLVVVADTSDDVPQVCFLVLCDDATYSHCRHCEMLGNRRRVTPLKVKSTIFFLRTRLNSFLLGMVKWPVTNNVRVVPRFKEPPSSLFRTVRSSVVFKVLFEI